MFWDCDDLLVLVAQFLTWPDWIRMSLTARTFNSRCTLADKVVTLHHDLSESAWLSFLQNRAHLRRLQSTTLTDQILGHLGTTRSLNAVGHLGGLQWLDCHASPAITDQGLQSIYHLRQLRYLHLGYCDITDRGLAGVGALTQLESLDLSDCSITDAGLVHLEACLSLQHLVLAHCSRLTSLISVVRLTQLQHLDVNECFRLTDTHLVRALSRLVSLNLSGCNVIPPDLGSLTQLRHLNLSFGLLPNTGLPPTCLTQLDLAGTDVDDDDLQWVSRLQELRCLNLGDCDAITDTGLALVGQLSQLQYLNVSLCSGITDDGLSGLIGLEQLQCLDLGQCDQLTDRALPAVHKIKHLKHLDLTACTQITPRALLALQKRPLEVSLSMWENTTACYRFHFRDQLPPEVFSTQVENQFSSARLRWDL